MRITILLLPNLTLCNLTEPATVVVLEENIERTFDAYVFRRRNVGLVRGDGISSGNDCRRRNAVITTGDKARCVRVFPA